MSKRNESNLWEYLPTHAVLSSLGTFPMSQSIHVSLHPGVIWFSAQGMHWFLSTFGISPSGHFTHVDPLTISKGWQSLHEIIFVGSTVFLFTTGICPLPQLSHKLVWSLNIWVAEHNAENAKILVRYDNQDGKLSMFFSISGIVRSNKTKDWALVQTAALVINKGVKVRLG